ncbi:uncharacterized protein [Cardiocondyla obscurior]|uniref:uncharacterized protein n=1 Tax=Cardiocondyla obscurior TaxID=286306 RepID=UPI0039656043
MRQRLFPDVTLRPKHHYLSHYSKLTLEFGPLMKIWTMRFESKHQFFKRTIRNFHNFINVVKCLSEKHELLQSLIRVGTDKRLETQVYELTHFNIDMYQEDIKKTIRKIHLLTDDFQQCTRVVLRGFKMPLFKIESLDYKRILISAESILQIIDIAIKKLNLPADDVYTLALQENGTQIDDDNILIQLSQLNSTPIVLSLINKTQKASPSTSTSSTNSVYKKTCVLNMKEGVWDKVSDTVLSICQRGEKLQPAQRQAINRIVADYMFNVLKQTSRVAEKIALNICETYPKTFRDTIDNEQWGSGVESLRMQIYNYVLSTLKVCLRMFGTPCIKHTKNRKRALIGSDSDNADFEERKKETATSRRQDEYGCVEYAPRLPSTENSKSQEEKRLRLLKLFANVERNNREISQLMTETYPTLRGIINEKSRKIEEFLVEWPFLKEPEFFLEHSSMLLGKNVQKIWIDSLSKKVKPIRQYIKFNSKESEKVIGIINQCKEAAEVTRDNVPKIFVIFSLLIEYFEKKINYLIKVSSTDTVDADVLTVADSDYPVLIIRGTSLYDSAATCTVVIERKIMIFCDDVFQGILICFLTYYVFGFCYPKEAEKTLEFIQRVFLNINPISGGKRINKSKRRGKTFDTEVFNLAKAALSAFPDANY